MVRDNFWNFWWGLQYFAKNCKRRPWSG